MSGAQGGAALKAICSIPVQIYDREIAGIYDVGDALEGEKARLALVRYPQYFVEELPGRAKKRRK
jgi:hypothetical protein